MRGFVSRLMYDNLVAARIEKGVGIDGGDALIITTRLEHNIPRGYYIQGGALVEHVYKFPCKAKLELEIPPNIDALNVSYTRDVKVELEGEATACAVVEIEYGSCMVVCRIRILSLRTS